MAVRGVASTSDGLNTSIAGGDECLSKPPDLFLASLGHGTLRRAGLVHNPSVYMRPGAIDKEIPMALLPSFSEDAVELDALDDYLVLGKGIRLKSAVALQPPLFTAFGARRWLEEYTSPPRNKVIQKNAVDHV